MYVCTLTLLWKSEVFVLFLNVRHTSLARVFLHLLTVFNFAGSCFFIFWTRLESRDSRNVRRSFVTWHQRNAGRLKRWRFRGRLMWAAKGAVCSLTIASSPSRLQLCDVLQFKDIWENVTVAFLYFLSLDPGGGPSGPQPPREGWGLIPVQPVCLLLD